MPVAKVSNIDAIRHFRTAMIKFAEQAGAAIANADSDVQRAESWLNNDAKIFWQHEIRKRQDAVTEAADKVRMKTLFKNFDGTTPSAVDEKKALDKAKQRLVIAEQKSAAVRRYTTIMEKESLLYKGSMQRFSTTMSSSVPLAIAQLQQVIEAINRYLQATPISAPTGTDTATSETPASAAGEMTRAEPVEAAPKPEAEPEKTETKEEEKPAVATESA